MTATCLDRPAVASSGTRVEEADIAVAERLGRHRAHPAIRSVGALSEIADQAPAFAACGALLAAGLLSGRPRMAEAGARMLASVLVATAMKDVVKGVVTRTRPFVLLDRGEYELSPGARDGGEQHSFPSGHTADAVAGARGFARIYPEAGTAAYAGAAVIAAVQIPRARHYPLDVLGGVLVGLAAEWAVDRTATALLSWARRNA